MRLENIFRHTAKNEVRRPPSDLTVRELIELGLCDVIDASDLQVITDDAAHLVLALLNWKLERVEQNERCAIDFVADIPPNLRYLYDHYSTNGKYKTTHAGLSAYCLNGQRFLYQRQEEMDSVKYQTTLSRIKAVVDTFKLYWYPDFF